MRAIVPAALITLLAAGCTQGGPGPAPATTSPGTTTSQPESVAPSITRQVPPEQRRALADASAKQLCGLVTVDELGKLAFPVGAGAPREIGLEPSVRGCQFEAQNGSRSILIGSQPDGFGGLGDEEVELGAVRGTQQLHVNDCTVFAPQAGATLQVTVNAPEADSDDCETAQGITQYVLAGVR